MRRVYLRSCSLPDDKLGIELVDFETDLVLLTKIVAKMPEMAGPRRVRTKNEYRVRREITQHCVKNGLMMVDAPDRKSEHELILAAAMLLANTLQAQNCSMSFDIRAMAGNYHLTFYATPKNAVNVLSIVRMLAEKGEV